MREMIVSELTRAMQELVKDFARFLPRLIVFVIIAFAGWVIAYLLKTHWRGSILAADSI